MCVAVALPHSIGCLLPELLQPLLHAHARIPLQEIQVFLYLELHLQTVTTLILCWSAVLLVELQRSVAWFMQGVSPTV